MTESIDLTGITIDEPTLVDSLRRKPRTIDGALRSEQIAFLGSNGLIETEAVATTFTFQSTDNLTYAVVMGEGSKAPRLDAVTGSPEDAQALFETLPEAFGMTTISIHED